MAGESDWSLGIGRLMLENPRLRPPGGTGWLAWLRHYRTAWLGGDVTAGLVVSVMIIPQSMAYAMLAGLPVEMGLYASILPLIGYALFASSMTLSVGPVAVTGLMTASLIAPLAPVGTALYQQLAIWLALLSGAMLFVLGLLRMGFLANFLSHPVISGFLSGAALLIIFSQLPHVFGLVALPHSPDELIGQWHAVNTLVTLMGLASLGWLVYARSRLAGQLVRLRVHVGVARLAARLAPILVVVLGIASTATFDLGALGVPVVGDSHRDLHAGMLLGGVPYLVRTGKGLRTLAAESGERQRLLVVSSGGAISIGHPIGASGARVPVALLRGMQREQANKGLATLCIGGGHGVAMAVE